MITLLLLIAFVILEIHMHAQAQNNHIENPSSRKLLQYHDQVLSLQDELRRRGIFRGDMISMPFEHAVRDFEMCYVMYMSVWDFTKLLHPLSAASQRDRTHIAYLLCLVNYNELVNKLYAIPERSLRSFETRPGALAPSASGHLPQPAPALGVTSNTALASEQSSVDRRDDTVSSAVI